MQVTTGDEDKNTDVMTFEQWQDKVEGVIRDTSYNFGNLMLSVAMTANTLMKQRVTEKGEMADGSKFAPYSTKPLSVSEKTYGMTKGTWGAIKSKYSKGELKLKGAERKAYKLAGGYKEYRETGGRQTSHVDFVFTGRMMADIDIVSPRTDLDMGRAVIKARTREQEAKLENLTELKGDILALSDSEERELNEVIERWLEKQWNE
jgi:hypothetical protein